MRVIERALKRAKELGMPTKKAFAEAMGATSPDITNWLARDDMPPARYEAAAAALKWSVDELLGKRPPSGREVAIDDSDEFQTIRRVTFKLSAGASGFAVEYIEDDADPIVFRKEWFHSRGFIPAKLFAVKIANGSMQPGLWPGDTVVVNTGDTTPRDGEVFAVNYEGELVVKRLVRDEGRWWLLSDNPDQRRYPRKVCDEHCIVIGAIVHKQSEHI